ncbi:hypothetical protein FGO68_gene12324 [Halteria grandinella]|uniref:Uncharacterized protein n=1 Tax=Halteria grandinella TaxID=5974 RepID=A0A8J8NA39_HALGN|nr:hypothetical protein FGO68_gene12324 [Halteria grandinella]
MQQPSIQSTKDLTKKLLKLSIGVSGGKVAKQGEGYCFTFQLEFAIRMVKVLHMDFSELSKDGTLPNHFSDFDEQKFLLIPNFQKCSVFLDTDRGFEDKYKPRPNQIVVHNLQIDKVEVRRRNEFLMQLPIEVPCQGLISSVIHYQKCLRDIQDIVGGQMGMKSYQLVHLKSITEMQEDEDGSGGVYTTILDEPYSPGNGEMMPLIATVRREAHTTSSDQSAENASLNGDQKESSITLPQILEYVQSPEQQTARQYFAGRDRQNYTTTDRDLYARLKTDRGLKEFHTLLHTFISDQVTKSKQHLQTSKSRNNFTRLSSKPGPLGFSKPILKQTQCGGSIDSDKLKDPVEANYFKSVTSSVQKKREEHLKKTLEWANKGYSQGGYDSYDEDRPPVQQQADEDVDMVDASEDAEPAFFRRASFVSGGAANGGDKPFARVSNDFSFMKKRVRVNAVDRHVKEYPLDQEERDAKKQKGKKKY